jgi:hypothetical protein
MQEGPDAIWPIATYRDERGDVSVRLALGPDLHFTITENCLPNARDDARYTADSIAYMRLRPDE